MADDADILRIGTTVADLGQLYPWLEAVAHDLPKPMVRKMHVALEEAVVNVAIHAYAPGDAGEITIRLHAAPDATALVVEDSGPAFDPTLTTPRSHASKIEDAEIGGLGLTLLRHYCSGIGYERTDGRNRLTLRFA